MLATTVALAISACLCLAGDWPHWRGPFYNGSADEKNLPESWSKTKNIAWVAPLPGRGPATPVVSGDRVFVSSTVKGSKDLQALCIRCADGKVLWKKTLGVAGASMRSTPAAPSPVTDGKKVYFLYATGLLTGLDVKGNVLWSRDLSKAHGDITVKFGYAASPLLWEGRLYVPVLRKGGGYGLFGRSDPSLDSFLLAVDSETGKTVWKQPRPTKARAESKDSYSSPIPCKAGAVSGVLVAGADNVTCHDPRTGKELWRHLYADRRHSLWRLVPSPVVLDGLICVPVPRGTSLLALRPPAPGGKPGMAWTFPGPAPDVSTPLFYKGLLYVLDGSKRKTMTCLDPATGKEVWQKKLGGWSVYWASPTGADGKVYCINSRGDVVVLAAGRKYSRLAAFSMDEEDCLSSIAAAGGSLFIRTATKLYCVRKPAKAAP